MQPPILEGRFMVLQVNSVNIERGRKLGCEKNALHL
jgi:hypothetical protein